MTAMAMVPAQSLAHIPVAYGSGSVFPRVDRMIYDGADATEYQKALTCIPRISDIKYQSITDMLLCELVPIHQPQCVAYYNGEGPQLRDIVNAVQISILERYLVQALNYALKLFQKKRAATWPSMRRFIEAPPIPQARFDSREVVEQAHRWLLWQEVSRRHPDLKREDVWDRLLELEGQA